MLNSYKSIGASLAAAALLIVTACERAPLINVVKDFQSAAASAVPGIRKYFLDINDVERDAVIDQAVANRKRIDLAQMEASRLIGQNDLQARLDALSALMKYGNLLAALASTNIVESVSGSIEDLRASASTLEGDLRKLSNPGAETNERFSGASSAFAGVATTLATSALNKRTDDAIIASIKTADKPVQTLVAVLKEDLRTAVAARRVNVSAARVNATDQYNLELNRTPAPDPVRLVTLGNEIKKAERRWELFNADSPADLVDGFAEAHRALVKAAQNPRSPACLAAVVSAVDAFTTRVKNFSALVNSLQGL